MNVKPAGGRFPRGIFFVEAQLLGVRCDTVSHTSFANGGTFLISGDLRKMYNAVSTALQLAALASVTLATSNP
jgi:hypothetical protein